VTLRNAIAILAASRFRYGRSRWRAIVMFAITLAFGLPQSANGQTTYYYSGNPFTSPVNPQSSQNNPECVSGTYDCISGNVTATVKYYGPGNFVFTLNAPGVSENSTDDSIVPSSIFDIINGIPTYWDLELQTNLSVPYVTDIATYNLPPATVTDTVSYTSQSGQFVVGYNGGDPGVWSTSPPTPPITVTATTGGPVSESGGDTSILVTAIPTDFNMTLGEVASNLGYPDGLDWVQTILSIPLPSPIYQAGNPCVTAAIAANKPYRAVCPGLTSTIDPPLYGYYEQESGNPTNLGPGPWPFYYDPTTAASRGTSNSFSLYDNPADPCLPGGTVAGCGLMPATSGAMVFQDQLVGIVPCSTPGVGECNYEGLEPSAPIPFLYCPGVISGSDCSSANGTTITDFDWADTFNGSAASGIAVGSGGIYIVSTNNLDPVEAGTGTGGITILSAAPVTEPSTMALLIPASFLAWLLRRRGPLRKGFRYRQAV